MWIDPHGVRRRRRPESPPLQALRGISAAMFIVTGIETAAGTRRGDPRPVHGLRAVPSVVAPLAVSAHVVHALRPTRRTAGLARLADRLAIVAGAAGLAASVLAALDERRWPGRRGGGLPSLAPLAFGLTGVLGTTISGLEHRRAAELERLARAERRARLLERIFPRRAKRDRFVIRL